MRRVPSAVSESESCVEGEGRTALCKVLLESSNRHRLNSQAKLRKKDQIKEKRSLCLSLKDFRIKECSDLEKTSWKI